MSISGAGISGFSLLGPPVSQFAARLPEEAHAADIENRTIRRTDMRLATGDLVTMRTIFVVFDHDPADGWVVSPGARLKPWAISLYTPAPESALLEVLCTYDDREEAVAEHERALSMVATGLNEVADKPHWSRRLSWQGPA
ncbi:hypothetical protein ACF06W_11370 [Streptomyces albus]|uniref:hypothetical protein n=1 Tax=Streptomyces albus TaxID=1888 RepID=UPI0037018767